MNINNLYNKYGIHRIPVIYYINSKNQIDRKNNIIAEMNNINYNLNNLIRIDSINIDKIEDCPKNWNKIYDAYPGSYGCSLSHIKTLKIAEKTNHDLVLIIEDDLEWIENENIIN